MLAANDTYLFIKITWTHFIIMYAQSNAGDRDKHNNTSQHDISSEKSDMYGFENI